MKLRRNAAWDRDTVEVISFKPATVSIAHPLPPRRSREPDDSWEMLTSTWLIVRLCRPVHRVCWDQHITSASNACTIAACYLLFAWIIHATRQASNALVSIALKIIERDPFIGSPPTLRSDGKCRQTHSTRVRKSKEVLSL